MRIAILGATSHIAKDLIRSLSCDFSFDLWLYARRPEAVRKWLSTAQDARAAIIGDFSSFAAQKEPFDAIINFIGSGNPAQTGKMGSSILDITREFDDLVLDKLRRQPRCRYIFFSSGAAYGSGFTQPVSDNTTAQVPINHMQASDWYGLSKLYTECRHRALPELGIVDVRVFSYFSSSADITTQFLVSEILSSIKDKSVLKTSDENIVRDYVGPEEIAQLVHKILNSPYQNVAVDFFSRAPVDKISLLEGMKKEFGLNYEILTGFTSITTTRMKLNYYSNSRLAANIFGYSPQSTSQEVVIKQSRKLISNSFF
jgi:nucleoside-diphosphate-sugar epimerase